MRQCNETRGNAMKHSAILGDERYIPSGGWPSRGKKGKNNFMWRWAARFQFRWVEQNVLECKCRTQWARPNLKTTRKRLAKACKHTNGQPLWHIGKWSLKCSAMNQKHNIQVLSCVVNQTMCLQTATTHVKVWFQAPPPIKSTYVATAANAIQQAHANKQPIQ